MGESGERGCKSCRNMIYNIYEVIRGIDLSGVFGRNDDF